MAKLSAKGRKELVRVSKFMELTDEQKSMGMTRARITRALMSDNKVLEKYDTWYTDQYSKNGVRHNTHNWTVKGTLKKDVTPAMFKEVYMKKGFTPE